jgi:hypothetical protein
MVIDNLHNLTTLVLKAYDIWRDLALIHTPTRLALCINLWTHVAMRILYGLMTCCHNLSFESTTTGRVNKV